MIRSVSYGGGVQSTALLVLAAQRRIDFPLFIFANVGDDSEHPDTLRYVREVAMPYAAKHDIELVEVRHTRRDGTQPSIRDAIDARRMVIPVRRTTDGKPMSRTCTADWKVGAIRKELRRRGASAADPALVALGISIDEIDRARPGLDPQDPSQIRTYPLLASSSLDPHSDGLELHRRDCPGVISRAGLPVPPRSACFFCPFHSLAEWRRLREQRPDLFGQACSVERQMSASTSDNRPVFLTRYGRPLAEVVVLDQQTMDLGDDDGCGSGWCFT